MAHKLTPLVMSFLLFSLEFACTNLTTNNNSFRINKTIDSQNNNESVFSFSGTLNRTDGLLPILATPIPSNIISYPESKIYSSTQSSSFTKTMLYQEKKLLIVRSGSNSKVHKGDMIAISINKNWKNISWIIDENTVIPLDIIEGRYAITTIPSNLLDLTKSVTLSYTLNNKQETTTYANSLKVLVYPEYVDCKGTSVLVAATGTETEVISGTKIAIPIDNKLKDNIQNLYLVDDFGNIFTYVDIIDGFAIYTVPSTIKPNNQNVILKDSSTNDILNTFENSLYKIPLSINLTPLRPTDAKYLPNTSFYPPFIKNNSFISVHSGDIVSISVKGLSVSDNVTVTIDGQNMPIYDQKDNYLSFEVQGNLSGTYNVNIKTDADSLTYTKALAILTHKIVFDSGRFGNQEIMLMDVNGSNQTRLTNHQDTYNYGPDWNPDKTLIQYRETNNNNFIDIAIIKPDGTGYQNITNTPDIDELNVRYSYDGKKFIYTSNHAANKDIWIMNTDGSNKINLTANSTEDDYNATWSPDGTKIAFTSERDGNPEIYIMNSDGTNQTRLTDNPLDDNTVKFSPTGDKLSYTSETKGNNTSQIWIMNPDGSSKEKLTDEDDYDNKWSTDGNKISYRVWKTSTNVELKIVDINTRQITTLTNNGKMNQQSNWLSDGSKLLFTSNVSGGNEVYSISLDGNNLLRLTNNNFSDYNASGYVPRPTFSILSLKNKNKQRIINRRLKYQDSEFVKPIRIKNN